MNEEFIMGAIYIVTFATIMIHLGLRVKNSVGSPASNSMLDIMAASPPRYSKRELSALVNSKEYDCMSWSDQIMTLQDMVQTFISPGMTFEEAIHVRELFITALITSRGTVTSEQFIQQEQPFLN